MTPSLFCPNCLSYFPSGKRCPVCGQPQKNGIRPPQPGKPAWTLKLSGRMVGGAVPFQGDRLLIAWAYQPQRDLSHPPDGGVSAYQVESGQLVWEACVGLPARTTPLVLNDHILLLTGGYGLDPSQLIILDLAGTIEQTFHFPGPLAPAIHPVDNQHVLLAGSDGNLLLVDLVRRRFDPYLRFDRERLAAPRCLTGRDNTFYIANSSRLGEVLGIRDRNVTKLLTAKGYLTSLKTHINFLTATDDRGNLYLLEQNGQLGWQYSTPSYKGIPASPVSDSKSLYFGAADHIFRAVSVSDGQVIWETPTHGTPTRALLVHPGLVLFGDSHGYLYGLDQKTGKVIWSISMAETRVGEQITSRPVQIGENVIFGANSGQVWAIPWHGGNYREAGDYLLAAKDPLKAAEFYTVEFSLCSLCDQDDSLKKAVATWEMSLEPEWAARLLEGIGECLEAATSYEKAAKSWRSHDPERAANYWLCAANLYEKEYQQDSEHSYARDESNRCIKQASALKPLPLLRMELITRPMLIQYRADQIMLRITNIGRRVCTYMALHVGGTLTRQIGPIIPQSSLEPGQFWDFCLEITPTQEKNDLVIYAEYLDVMERPGLFRGYWSTELLARKSSVIVEGKDTVGTKISVKTSEDQLIQVKLGNMVYSEVNIEA